jgi:hypothetical protein
VVFLTPVSLRNCSFPKSFISSNLIIPFRQDFITFYMVSQKV